MIKRETEITKDSDSAKCMARSFSSLINILPEGIHEQKWNFGQDDKTFETYEIKYKAFNCFLNIQALKMIFSF